MAAFAMPFRAGGKDPDQNGFSPTLWASGAPPSVAEACNETNYWKHQGATVTVSSGAAALMWTYGLVANNAANTTAGAVGLGVGTAILLVDRSIVAPDAGGSEGRMKRIALRAVMGVLGSGIAVHMAALGVLHNEVHQTLAAKAEMQAKATVSQDQILATTTKNISDKINQLNLAVSRATKANDTARGLQRKEEQLGGCADICSPLVDAAKKTGASLAAITAQRDKQLPALSQQLRQAKVSSVKEYDTRLKRTEADLLKSYGLPTQLAALDKVMFSTVESGVAAGSLMAFLALLDALPILSVVTRKGTTATEVAMAEERETQKQWIKAQHQVARDEITTAAEERRSEIRNDLLQQATPVTGVRAKNRGLRPVHLAGLGVAATVLGLTLVAQHHSIGTVTASPSRPATDSLTAPTASATAPMTLASACKLISTGLPNFHHLAKAVNTFATSGSTTELNSAAIELRTAAKTMPEPIKAKANVAAERLTGLAKAGLTNKSSVSAATAALNVLGQEVQKPCSLPTA